MRRRRDQTALLLAGIAVPLGIAVSGPDATPDAAGARAGLDVGCDPGTDRARREDGGAAARSRPGCTTAGPGCSRSRSNSGCRGDRVTAEVEDAALRSPSVDDPPSVGGSRAEAIRSCRGEEDRQ